jgi:hypothetical protein
MFVMVREVLAFVSLSAFCLTAMAWVDLLSRLS